MAGRPASLGKHLLERGVFCITRFKRSGPEQGRYRRPQGAIRLVQGPPQLLEPRRRTAQGLGESGAQQRGAGLAPKGFKPIAPLPCLRLARAKPGMHV